MKKVLYASLVLVMLSGLNLSYAADGPTEVTGSLSWNDSTETHYRAITGAFDLTFPVGKHFAIGPVFRYDYLRLESPDAPAPVPPLDLIETETTPTPPPDPGVTSSDPLGDTVSVWSFGGRGVFHFSESRNGVYLAAEAMIPQEDAEGYIITPEAGFEFGIGGSAFGRVAYKRPYHRDSGDFVDLGSQQVVFGFGARF
jgi:hypothetical protein